MPSSGQGGGVIFGRLGAHSAPLPVEDDLLEHGNAVCWGFGRFRLPSGNLVGRLALPVSGEACAGYNWGYCCGPWGTWSSEGLFYLGFLC